MSVWFRMAAKPTLRFQHLDREQLAELSGLLDSAWRVTRHATLSDVRQGWQLLEICGRAVSDREDVLSPAWKNGRVWLKLGEPRARNVKPSAEEKRVAGFFLHFIEAVKPLYLVESHGQPCLAAADAFASHNRAGIGGWWLPAGAPLCVSELRWFSYQFSMDALPAWFKADATLEHDANLQLLICALEALAQLVLLALQRRQASHSNVGCLVIRQFCHNMGVVGASATGFSMKEPLASVLQAWALFCLHEGINFRVAHMAGERNQWADALSRGPDVDPAFWSQLRDRRRCWIDWQSLVNSGRPEALPTRAMPAKSGKRPGAAEAAQSAAPCV